MFYTAMRRWLSSTGSSMPYIEQQVEKARAENAPLDALFQRDCKWICVSDLSPDHYFRDWYERHKVEIDAQERRIKECRESECK